MRLPPQKTLGGGLNTKIGTGHRLQGSEKFLLCFTIVTDNKPLFMHCGACRTIPTVKVVWMDAVATSKNPGGGSNKKIGPGHSLQRSERFLLCFTIVTGNKPLFMHCGAYRAIPTVKVVWMDAVATPKNTGGGIEYEKWTRP